ncbi:rRNA biogenesis protein RRP5, partial [Thalictrum thalictroides]
FDGNNLVLSAKYSLINSAKELPADATQFDPNSVIHGYICNIIESGCFVRFLGRVTAFSPKHKAIDNPRADISESFYVGQSVRSHVLNVDSETGRITLSLKQSSCFSKDASFLEAYFLLEEKIAKLQLPNSENSDFKWVRSFSLGTVVEGEVHEAKEFGVVLSFKEHKDVFGFVSHYQLGGTNVETGSVVQAMVLDIAKTEHLVDLSLKPDLVSRVKEHQPSFQNGKKKRKRDVILKLEVHQTVNAIVEIVKEHYLARYASIADYNTQKLPHRHFVNGQSVVATVGALPCPSTSGRLLLLLNSLSEVKETSSSKRAKKKSAYNVGSLVEAEITDIKPLELQLKFGFGFRGRLHITEATDDHNVEDPFKKFRIGQMLTAKIVEKIDQSEKNKSKYQWELSIKSTVLSGSEEMADGLTTDESNFSTGRSVSGYVVAVDNEWVWLTVSRRVKAQLFLLDSSCEPHELQEFQKRFTVGKSVTGYIINYNKEKRMIRLLLRPLSVVSRGVNNNTMKIDDLGSMVSMENVGEHIHEGDVLGGRITKVFPGVSGLFVQIGPHLYGKVHYTELADEWLASPLAIYEEGQFVKCKVLEVSRSVKGTMQIDLSLRNCTKDTQNPNSLGLQNDQEFPSPRIERIEELKPNMIVQGYVKNVMSKGCFIMLSRKVDAKVLLSNLANSFVENPDKEFPIGKLVQGKVLSVEPLSKRVEVTLKTETTGNASKFEGRDFSSLHVGDVVSGRIKRIETFGLFITIEQTNMVGLCHVSELSDILVANIESKYRVGERVVAKILKVDEERHRISLGMKESYMKNTSNVPEVLNQTTGDSNDDRSVIGDCPITSLQACSIPSAEDSEDESAYAQYPVPTYDKSRASIPPLEVTFDEMDDSELANIGGENQEHLTEVTNPTEKNRRREKKKAKDERELEISAAEQRLLEKDTPRNADEFEKLIRSSPNNSFVWIKYMAYMLSLADIEKARSIAERALQTINIREEAEKLNVWVAYFNLENEYGNPREEAVTKTFERALQYCDPKKVHLALLGMYERTEQYKLVDELLEKMLKKFKRSCKVWLRQVQCILKQGKDGIQFIVKRAVVCLPRNKHIKFLSQTAILEFKCGVPDRGRSMFEEMLREYPKRTDLWSVYLDQEIRLGDADVIRALFERASSLSLPPKKMKFLFNKYMEYEKAHGDEERVDYVRRKAVEYMESALT